MLIHLPVLHVDHPGLHPFKGLKAKATALALKVPSRCQSKTLTAKTEF